MSALGQKRTSENDWIMSALPSKADIAEHDDMSACRIAAKVPVAL
jgi:hypothetical protein